MNLTRAPDNHLSLDVQTTTQHDNKNDVGIDAVNSEHDPQSTPDIVQLLMFSV